MKISIKLRVFSNRLFEHSHHCGGGVYPGGLMGWWWATVGWGGNSAVEGSGAMGGSTVGVSSTSKNHLKQTWKALIALNAGWALPVYPLFEDQKSTASDKNRSREKSQKKTDRTIIAKNFVWEQLINKLYDRESFIASSESTYKIFFKITRR